MDNKKHFASLLEDHSPGPSTTALRPSSPFQTDCRPGAPSGDGGSTCGTPSHSGLDLDLTQTQVALSCV
jgi:hypothetical protein